MDSIYKIRGGIPISGNIECNGAKNFITKAMVAGLLSKEVSHLFNVPDIIDVDETVELFEEIGAKINHNKQTKELRIDPSTINLYQIEKNVSNRIPVLLIPILLYYFKKATIPLLNGCNIGLRRINFHADVLKQIGANIIYSNEYYYITIESEIRNFYYRLPFASVGTTENCIFFAVLAKGHSLIENIAIEPEIIELIALLNKMGADIKFIDERKIRINGGLTLFGVKYEIIGDRLDAASWAILACATNGSITVKGINYNLLDNFLPIFSKVGGGYKILDEKTIVFFRNKNLEPITIETNPYPGFSTDLMPLFAILLALSYDDSIIHETIFDNRLDFLDSLAYFGMKSLKYKKCLLKATCRFDELFLHSAIIKGNTTIKVPTQIIPAGDIRKGFAIVIAAALAKGTTYISDCMLIERGYGELEERLKSTNFDIQRIIPC